MAKTYAGWTCPRCQGAVLKTPTPGLELCDKVAGAVGGRESPGDSIGRGGGPVRRQHSIETEPHSYCPAPGPGLGPLDWTCPSFLDLRERFHITWGSD